MILGIGIDICKICRIERLMQYKNVVRILSQEELENIKKLDKYILAKKWVAKEALAKAVGIGIGKIGFANITIAHTLEGQPYIKLNDLAKKIIDSVLNTNYKIHISISDEMDYALANVILEQKS